MPPLWQSVTMTGRQVRGHARLVLNPGCRERASAAPCAHGVGRATSSDFACRVVERPGALAGFVGRVSGLVFEPFGSVFWHFAHAIRAVTRFWLLVCFFVSKKTDEQCKPYCCRRSEAQMPKDGTAESEILLKQKQNDALKSYAFQQAARKCPVPGPSGFGQRDTSDV